MTAGVATRGGKSPPPRLAIAVANASRNRRPACCVGSSIIVSLRSTKRSPESASNHSVAEINSGLFQ